MLLIGFKRPQSISKCDYNDFCERNLKEKAKAAGEISEALRGFLVENEAIAARGKESAEQNGQQETIVTEKPDATQNFRNAVDGNVARGQPAAFRQAASEGVEGELNRFDVSEQHADTLQKVGVDTPTVIETNDATSVSKRDYNRPVRNSMKNSKKPKVQSQKPPTEEHTETLAEEFAGLVCKASKEPRAHKFGRLLGEGVNKGLNIVRKNT